MNALVQHPSTRDLVERIAHLEEALREISRGYWVAPDDLAEIAQQALGPVGDWDFQMTKERAAFVRKLRIDDDLSWRGVASRCAEEWGHDWGGNQLYGIEICKQAARYYGDDAMVPPWN